MSVHNCNYQDSDQEVWLDDGDQDNSANDTGNCRDQHSKGICQGVVEGIDVFGKTIEHFEQIFISSCSESDRDTNSTYIDQLA